MRASSNRQAQSKPTAVSIPRARYDGRMIVVLALAVVLLIVARRVVLPRLSGGAGVAGNPRLLGQGRP